MKYTVAIVEMLVREVTVEAENAEAAIDQVEAKYDAEEIVLTADDHISTTFNVKED